ncbi:MFS transporter [bacterium]|nr:MFS transporter [bacterium]
MLFLSTVLNYVDRQLLSFLAPTLKKELGFGNLEYSWIVSAFTIATVAALFFVGPIIDKIGTRVGFVLFIGIWSVSAAMHALLPTGTITIGAMTLSAGLVGLIVLRSILAIGEAGNWPCAGKAVAEWFPTRERGLAMGFFNGGVSIGAIVAPWIMGFALAVTGNWRLAFVVTPVFVIAWVAFWLYLYHAPGQHPRITAEERELIEHDQVKGKKAPFWEVAVKPRFWGIFIARALASPVWFFVAYWIANYLNDKFGFNWTKITAVAWIPFATADIGNIVGGWWSGALIANGRRPIASRIIVMGIGAVGMMVSFLIAETNTAALAIALISFLTFAWGLWVANMLALVSDSFPKQEVATVMSWSGIGQQGGTTLFTLFTGWWLAFSAKPGFSAEAAATGKPSYTVILVVAALLPIVSYIFTVWLNREQAAKA